MAVYGPGCHPQNIIWSEANRTEPKGRSEKSQLIHTFTESKDSNCFILYFEISWYSEIKKIQVFQRFIIYILSNNNELLIMWNINVNCSRVVGNQRHSWVCICLITGMLLQIFYCWPSYWWSATLLFTSLCFYLNLYHLIYFSMFRPTKWHILIVFLFFCLFLRGAGDTVGTSRSTDHNLLLCWRMRQMKYFSSLVD